MKILGILGGSGAVGETVGFYRSYDLQKKKKKWQRRVWQETNCRHQQEEQASKYVWLEEKMGLVLLAVTMGEELVGHDNRVEDQQWDCSPRRCSVSDSGESSEGRTVRVRRGILKDLSLRKHGKKNVRLHHQSKKKKVWALIKQNQLIK